MVNEIIGGEVNPQILFAEIKKDTPDLCIHNVLSHFRSRLGPMPYQSSDFETVSPIGEDNREALVRWMLSLPGGEEGYRLFRESCNLAQISDDAATHKALETMYVGPKPEEDEDKFLWGRLFIENIHNSMAVRNRLRIVRKEFRNFVLDILNERESDCINVLSIAAGSSRGLLEETSSLPYQMRTRIHLKLIDISPQAEEDARRLSQQLGITDRVEIVTGDVLKVNGYLEEGYRAHFIEVVGLLDYLKEKNVVNLLRRLRSYLTEGGMVLYSNIMPNDEWDFTEKIVGWPPMQDRLADGLVKFAQLAGFETDKTTVIREPLGVYNLVLARK